MVLRPVYSGDGLLTGEGGCGTSADVADFAGEKDGTGEGVGGAASVKMISSRTSAAGREKGRFSGPKVKASCPQGAFKKEIYFLCHVKPFVGSPGGNSPLPHAHAKGKDIAF